MYICSQKRSLAELLMTPLKEMSVSVSVGSNMKISDLEHTELRTYPNTEELEPLTVLHRVKSLQNLTSHFCQVTFCVRLVKTDTVLPRISIMETRLSHYSLLSYALILFRHRLNNVSVKIIYIDYIV